jgi:hypothetical protein
MQSAIACVLRSKKMAIYHLNLKPISRSAGHSMAAALAYETGQIVRDVDGQAQDYTRKGGVLSHEIIGTSMDLNAIARGIEFSETRKNSTLGRRMTIGLPEELPAEERREAAESFGKWLHEKYKVAVVVSVHEPSGAGDQRNHHAHITISDRRLDGDKFGEKARELTAAHSSKAELLNIREKWAEIANDYLSKHGKEQISHLSNKARGIEKTPTSHLGRVVTEQIRKGYKPHGALINQSIQQSNENQRIPTTPRSRSNKEDRGLQPARDSGDAERLEQLGTRIISRALEALFDRKSSFRSTSGRERTKQEIEFFGERTRPSEGKIQQLAGLVFQRLRGQFVAPIRDGREEIELLPHRGREHTRDSERRGRTRSGDQRRIGARSRQILRTNERHLQNQKQKAERRAGSPASRNRKPDRGLER